MNILPLSILRLLYVGKRVECCYEGLDLWDEAKDAAKSLSIPPFNLQVYAVLLEPRERIIALDLTHGEHLSQGYQTDTKKIFVVSIFSETKPYRSSEGTSYIDCYQLKESAYARLYDSACIRKVCDEQKVALLADVARLKGRQTMVPNMHVQKDPHRKPSLAPSSKTALVRSMISSIRLCNI
ncbi:hypothetical protein VNO77_20015 [Canavalia gladiata]|uniref:Serine hydroxymethyltransferase-like domain-containing protein n=1 Tax=Canavalia gladiata TaxID=3824 RepID=A0AAN9LS06_CANGL